MLKAKKRVHEVLEVARPGDVWSRGFNWAIAVLIVANVAAQVSTAMWSMDAAVPYLWWFRVGSVALFAVEYGARIWSVHASGASHLIARLRTGIHPLQIADLAVVLSLMPMVPVDLRFLRLLRLLRLIDLIRRTYHGAQAPESAPVFEDTIAAVRACLADERRKVRSGAAEDLRVVRGLTDQAMERMRTMQHEWSIQLRRQRQRPIDFLPRAREAVEEVFDVLQRALDDPERLRQDTGLIAVAYEHSAAVFADATEASLERDLEWEDCRSYHTVPLRQIGTSHFHDLEVKASAAGQHFERMYVSGTRDGLDGVRSAVRYVIDMVEDALSSGEATPHDVQLGFNRAVNRLSDLGEHTSATWESALWEMEREHDERMALVAEDAARHGQVDFWVGKLRRLGRRGTSAAWIGCREIVGRAVPFFREQAARVSASVSAVALPLLRRLGLALPPRLEARLALDEAKLESIQQLGLPGDYMVHFALEPLADESLFVGFDEELATIDRAIERWEEGRTSSFVVYGQRGAGKTTLLNMALKRLFDDDVAVTRDVIDRKIATESGLVSYLSGLFGFADADTFEDVGRRLLEGPTRAVILEGCHNLFIKRIGGLDAVRHLLWLIARTNHHVLWGICLEKHAHSYLSKWLPFRRLFHFDVPIQSWQPGELRRLVMQRHNQSGYRLRYAIDKDTTRIVHRRVRRWRRVEEPAVQEALAQICFERLAGICGENIFAALFYWLRALEPADSESHLVRPIEEIDFGILRDSSLEQAFILTAVLQHDNLTAEELSQILDTDLIQTRLELEILWNDSMLEFSFDTERFRINPVSLPAVGDMLAGRNLL